ncbi:hypothetical protein, partial [Acidovorax sp. LjRoot129]|uniref:hypothetical protein n=1 Tax=Acidovorax sp. LjRoot129 TaxID=3342260 RepID=UPI003F506652
MRADNMLHGRKWCCRDHEDRLLAKREERNWGIAAWYARRAAAQLKNCIASELGALPYAAMFANAPTTPPTREHSGLLHRGRFDIGQLASALD